MIKPVTINNVTLTPVTESESAIYQRLLVAYNSLEAGKNINIVAETAGYKYAKSLRRQFRKFNYVPVDGSKIIITRQQVYKAINQHIAGEEIESIAKELKITAIMLKERMRRMYSYSLRSKTFDSIGSDIKPPSLLESFLYGKRLGIWL